MIAILRVLLIYCFCFVLVQSFAQTSLDQVIQLDVEQADLPTIFNKIESAYGVSFFYKKEDLPLSKFTKKYEKTPLSDVLIDLLRGSGLGFSPYRDYALIIAPQTTLTENYSANYYQNLDAVLNGEKEEKKRKKRSTIGTIDQLKSSGKARLKGTIVGGRKSAIIGAIIEEKQNRFGTTTDENGTFELELEPGQYDFWVEYIGYKDKLVQIAIYSDGELEVKLRRESVELQEVTVGAEAADANIDRTEIGLEQLDIAVIKKLPAFLGEADVVKSLTLQPGVSTIGEGATGFHVRGGEVDQNLILQDEGFLFNASHALGFFSTFNTDLVSDVTLYKGSMPAQYGGRIASVLDVGFKNGSFKDFKIKAGIGPVSGRLSVEAPLVKDKASFIVGFRSSYSDWLLRQVQSLEVQRSSAFFYDANVRYTHRIGKKNTLILSGYSSDDRFSYNKEFGFEYSTLMGQLQWNSLLSKRLSSKFSVVSSRYKSAQLDLDGLNASQLDNQISYLKFKEQLTLFASDEVQWDMGISSVIYSVRPGELQPSGEASGVIPKDLPQNKGLESAVFANVEWKLSNRWTIAGGMRLVLYQALGPSQVYSYDANPPSLESVRDSSNQRGILATYTSLEPRLSARYRINETTSLKAGYSRTAQFINQIFNSATPTPTSQFQLSNRHIEPFRAHNMSIGLFKNFRDNLWETSIEAYARYIDVLFDYKDFAKLIANDHLETELRSGIGRAYGMELSLKKTKGVFNGWLSYTLSRSERKIEAISDDSWYPSNFDKTHDVSLILNYQYNKRNTISMNFNYSTGRPVTAPVGHYRTSNGATIPVYSSRNLLRIPDYHRLDLSYTLGQSYKKTRKIKMSWTFSIYNVYGRRNAFSVFFTPKPGAPPKANKLSILGYAFPALTLNLETN